VGPVVSARIKLVKVAGPLDEPEVGPPGGEPGTGPPGWPAGSRGHGPITVSGLSKTFGARTVLSQFAMTIPRGTVHGLLGANGSGKSTVIKILAGYHEPDDGVGELVIMDEQHSFPMTAAARREAGLGFVHQDLGLAAETTVAENLFIDDLAPRELSPIGWRKLEQRAAVQLARVGGGHIDPGVEVGRLQAVDRAIVAITRAMSNLRPGGLLVLDEVTTFLPRDGVETLFGLVRDVCAEGTSVLFVSHRLEEVRALCQTVTVLRNGHVIANQEVATTSDETLVADIVGAELSELYPVKHRPAAGTRFVVKGVTARGLGPISFEAQAGEIVGVTGLRGMGHENLPYVLYGDRPSTGSISVDGVELDLSRSKITDVIRSGIRLVPGDRLRQGAVGSASVQENATLPFISEFFRGGVLRGRAERAATEDLLSVYGVVPNDPGYVFSRLSGGNQQKVMLGRWLRTEPLVLLLDEPTQGVDVGARRDLFNRIVLAAQGGATVLYVSTETQDLAELCHRVLVFRDGAISKVVEQDDVTEESILRACWLREAA
jgi:ribose transport system ATP-binding protein